MRSRPATTPRSGTIEKANTTSVLRARAAGAIDRERDVDGPLPGRVVQEPVARPGREHAAHVVVGLVEGDALDELVGRAVPEGLEPPVDRAGPGVVGGDREVRLAAEAGQERTEVARPEADVVDGPGQVALVERLAQLARDVGRGAGHQL